MPGIAVVEPSRLGDMPLVRPIVGGGGEVADSFLLDDAGDELLDDVGDVLEDN